MKDTTEGIVRYNEEVDRYYIETQEFDAYFGMLLPEEGVRVRITVEEIKQRMIG